ncbi:MAG: hypothetical protein Q7R95_09340 [bacterium]|nr:hypothetical protein [bacterium]
MSKYYFFVGILSIVYLALIISVFVVIGTPFEQKAKNQDNIRSQRIQSLSSAISNLSYTNGKLPVSLSELNTTGSSDLTDPETKLSFTYKVNSTTKYSLCANFATVGTIDKSSPYSYLSNISGTGNPYVHKKGIDCINYTVTINQNNLNNPNINQELQKRIDGVDFASRIGKDYFIKKTSLTLIPKASLPNENNWGILHAGQNSFQISNDVSSSLYEIKNNPDEYFLALYTIFSNNNSDCKTVNNGKTLCSFNLDWIHLTSVNGKEVRRNIVGTADYVDVSTQWGAIPSSGSFPSNNSDNNFSGALGFFIKKQDFSNTEKTANYILKYDNGSDSQTPMTITIKFL